MFKALLLEKDAAGFRAGMTTLEESRLPGWDQADVLVRPLTVSAVTDVRAYDGSTQSVGVPTVTGLQTTDTLNGVLSQAFASKDVLGTGNSTLVTSWSYTVTDGHGGQNYAVSVLTAPGTITPAALTITAQDLSKVYGQTPDLTGLVTSALVNGETVGTVTLSSPGQLATAAVAGGAQPPRPLMASLSAPMPMPSLPVTDLSALPVGTPQGWLQRRPDLIVAERELAAANADIGVAKAALYPRLSLSGLLGFNSARSSDLFDAASGRWALGAGITWTPLDGGALRARVRASEARAQQSVVRFEQTVALALEETEGAFSSFSRESQRAARLDEAARQAETAAQLARVRFEAGVTDFLAVLDAEREALSQRDALVQAQVGTAGALVAVYRSLGGGWTPPAQPAR